MIFSWTGFHNAVVDVLVLAAVVPRLLSELRQRCITYPGLGQMLTELFPDAAASLDIPIPTNPEPLDTLIKTLGERGKMGAGRGREPPVNAISPR